MILLATRGHGRLIHAFPWKTSQVMIDLFQVDNFDKFNPYIYCS